MKRFRHGTDTKAIMEGCKERARDAGLRFQDETLEYIVTNRDLIELSPKIMIPTLYDYWVHDVEVLKEKGKYPAINMKKQIHNG